MTEIDYELRLKDHNGNVLTRFALFGRSIAQGGGISSFSYRKRLWTPGGSQVRIFGDDERIDQFLRLKLPGEAVPSHLDYRWEFYRIDKRFQQTLELDFATFHRYEAPDIRQDGTEVYVSHGDGYNALLYSEIIDFPEGSPKAKKSGDPATIVRQLVRQNIGDLAGVDDEGKSRVRPGLSVPFIPATGVFWKGGDWSYQNLGTVLRDIGEFTPGDFMVEPSGDGFVFRWGTPILGIDATGSAVFSIDLGTLSNLSVDLNYSNAVSSVRVLGSGSGATRITDIENFDDMLTMSPWARRTVSRPLSREGSLLTLTNRGQELLRDLRPRRIASFEIRNDRTVLYGRDWNVGDLVTVVTPFQSHVMKVVGVTISFRAGVETISGEFEDTEPLKEFL